MLPKSLVHHTKIVVQLPFLLERLFLLDSFQNMESFLSLSLFLKANSKIGAYFQKCWLTSRISHLRRLLCSVGRDLHDLLISFLVIVHCVFILILLVIDDPDIEVSFRKLLSKQIFDLWESFKLIFSNRFFEIDQSLVKLVLLKIETSQIKICFNIIRIVAQSLKINFNQLAKDSDSLRIRPTELNNRWLFLPFLNFIVVKHILK